MQQVFISYSRRDAEFVRALADDLKSRGVEIWLDTEDLASADDDRWRRSIVQGIRESTVLVVVLSPNSVASEQVERELTIAAETKRRIIPIVERPCELPDGFQFELAGIQRIDFSELPRDVALDLLVRRVGVGSAPVVSVAPASPTAGAVAGPTSVLPPPTSTTPAPAGSKPSTARPKPPVPAGMSAPTGLSSSPPRRRLVAAILGVGAAAALAIVLIVALGGRGDTDDVAGSEVTASNTEAATNDSAAPGSIDLEQPASALAAPPAQTDTESPPPGASGEETEADVFVQELQTAYNERDWDTVRRMIGEPEKNTDERLVETYGSADSFPRVEHATSVVLDRQQTGDSTWELTGGLLSWDYSAEQEKSTNVVCLKWIVDTEAGTARFSPFAGSDGEDSRRLDGYWLPEDQFESTAQQYCG